MPAKSDLRKFIGTYIGEIKIIRESPNAKRRSFVCQCSCGNSFTQRVDQLFSGIIKSCGCKNNPYRKAILKIYDSYDPVLLSNYQSMVYRCTNVKNNKYHLYGGRGISVCPEWLNDFIYFYKWAIENGYKKGLLLDRINNDGNYEPENCRYVTPAQSSINRSVTNYVEYKGVKKPLIEWCAELGLDRATVFGRLYHNWSPERAFNTPVIRRYKAA